MRRITLLRIVLLAPLFYLLLILLWVVLPSPDVPWGTDVADKTEDRLYRGETVTRVYDVDDFFPYMDLTPSVQVARRSQRDSFALTFAYDAPTGAFSVRGHGSTNTFNLNHPYSPKTETAAFVWWDTVKVEAKTGDHDGINLPGFSHADSALLYWEIHRDVATLPLWVTIEEGILEGKPIRRVDIKPDGEAFDPLKTNETNRAAPNSLLTLFVDPEHPTRSLRHAMWPRIRNSKTQSSDLRPFKPNSSPSRTFPIRRAIQAILVPSWFFIDEVVFPLIEASASILSGAVHLVFWLIIIYVVAVLAYWKASGAGAFWPWTRTFWMTRAMVRYLGARISPARFGTDVDKADLDGSEGETSDTASAVTSREGPTPLTSPWAFFTSSSPLDDLFVTFEATKPLVQPIGLRRRRTGDLEGQAGESTASASTTEVLDQKGSDEDFKSLA
ncbi:hypothetical protein H2200_000188 [Cladophialophora chaetospira]|uniref:Uncharacterized protein n=1 Tax=Cladophialophora chaetospira TaxID=386627 RepID=A0AA38XP05_9EURO|nr:hypothetical protein H2200_000188 [Cladophialophora chaetospira]